MSIEDYESDEAFLASYEYLLDSSINGQFSQCRALVEEHNHTVDGFTNYLESLDYDSEYILNQISRVFGA